jgi:chromosome segregation ATPase
MKAASTFLTVLAILGALAAGALWYLIKGQKETLTSERDGLRVEKASLEATRTDLTNQVNDLTGRNSALNSELGESKTRNTSLEARVNQLNRDVAQARANTESAQTDARKATEEAANLRRQVIELMANLEGTKASEEANRLALQERIKELETKLTNPYASSGNAEGEKTPLITTSVASVGPRSAFVVLNAGTEQGLRNQMRIAVSRGGEIVAQAVITEVRGNLAVAEIIPNTLSKSNAPRSGDEVFTVN